MVAILVLVKARDTSTVYHLVMGPGPGAGSVLSQAKLSSSSVRETSVSYTIHIVAMTSNIRRCICSIQWFGDGKTNIISRLIQFSSHRIRSRRLPL